MYLITLRGPLPCRSVSKCQIRAQFARALSRIFTLHVTAVTHFEPSMATQNSTLSAVVGTADLREIERVLRGDGVSVNESADYVHRSAKDGSTVEFIAATALHVAVSS